jgi:hypothetical protein
MLQEIRLAPREDVLAIDVKGKRQTAAQTKRAERRALKEQPGFADNANMRSQTVEPS